MVAGMGMRYLAAVAGVLLGNVWVTTAETQNVAAGCTVSSHGDLKAAISSCNHIVIKGVSVPANQDLNLELKSGTTVNGPVMFKLQGYVN
jgi:hypothetical protein